MVPKLTKPPRGLGTLVGLALFVAALIVLQHQLRKYHYHDVADHMRSLPTYRLALSLGLAILAYGCLTTYDLMAIRWVGRPMPYRKIALASFVGYAFSNNIGSAMISGGSVRMRLYTAWGLTALEVGQVVLFCTLTFWTGFCALAGSTLLFGPPELADAVGLPLRGARMIGLVFLLLVAGYLTLSVLRRRPIRVRDFSFTLPSIRLTTMQVVMAGLDLMATAGVLYNLLPSAPGLSFPMFAGVYVLALTAGLLSLVPGGVGVFESVMVLALSDKVPADDVVAALLVYRVFYYLLPLAAAAGLFGAYEVRQRREEVGRAVQALGQWVPSVVPLLLSIITFGAGTVMLFAGATPGVMSRLRWINQWVPLAFIEISHFMSSVVGVWLLVLARGLHRRQDGAYVLTVASLVAGIVFLILKGGEWEEAVILVAVLAAVLPSRKEFYRKTALASERFSPSWVAAILFALFAFVWLGLFSYKHLDFSSEMWWQFALNGHASRFLRATVGALSLGLMISARQLLRPPPAVPEPATEADLERVRPIVAASPNASGHLALLGDKRLLFSDDGKAFLMYGIERASWIALGDPIGPKDEIAELIWRFREMADRRGGKCAFYQVGTAHLPVYLDLGMTLLKLGENATVPLHGFSLQGAERKGLRHAVNKIEREGCTFEVAPPEAIPALMPELREISNAWMGEKNSKEKGFSLGFFDERYLANFHHALVRREGRVLAFANLWLGGGKSELSIDLMRHLPDAPGGVMDYLFCNLMLWGAREGYQRFDLGMAPLSGLEDRALAPLWSRIGGIVFRHGEHFYNFQGLREYKEKFNPDWEPRYLVSPGGLALGRSLVDIASLIGGGIRGVFAK